MSGGVRRARSRYLPPGVDEVGQASLEHRRAVRRVQARGRRVAQLVREPRGVGELLGRDHDRAQHGGEVVRDAGQLDVSRFAARRGAGLGGDREQVHDAQHELVDGERLREEGRDSEILGPQRVRFRGDDDDGHPGRLEPRAQA